MLRQSILLLLCALLAASLGLGAEGSDGQWKSIFDGKSLNGWKPNENPESWTVEDACIVGRGKVSHLFYMEQPCENCEFVAKVKLIKNGNSGMYFRAEFMPGWPKGYEAQVNNSSPDPRRTGSLYGLADVKEQLVPDDTWWEQHVIADGNHIIIKVNGKTVVDFVDEKNSFSKGYLALQQHDPGSVVHYKDLRMKKLPVKE